MTILAIIPARMGSSRFPGKPMALVMGKPMIGHVWERVSRSPLVTLTAVATCDAEIAEYVRSLGGVAVMTSDSHERASDRCAEALLVLEAERGLRYDFVVMVQGDEPMFHPDMVAEALQPLLNEPDLQVANLLAPLQDDKELEDRNCIKVVCDLRSNALYFSREPIPTRARGQQIPMGKQVCVIPFRRDFLLEYTRLKPTPLEIAESVDMLRVLEHGGKVRMVPTNHQTQSVDTEEDMRRVEELMRLEGVR